MKVLVDTSVLSLSLRRRPRDLSSDERVCRMLLEDLIRDGVIVLIGAVRQEVLSGISDPAVFNRLREHLRAFNDEPILTDDYEEAAQSRNRCDRAGIAASPIDMLICAVAIRLGAVIFTTDADFLAYARELPIKVPSAAELQHHMKSGGRRE